MANFKRKKCRGNCFRSNRGSETARRAKLGFKPHRIPDLSWWDWHAGRRWSGFWPGWYHPYSKSPAWWDRTYNTRPHRTKTRRMERKILTGQIDPEDAAWPLQNKPVDFYW